VEDINQILWVSVNWSSALEVVECHFSRWWPVCTVTDAGRSILCPRRSCNEIWLVDWSWRQFEALTFLSNHFTRWVTATVRRILQWITLGSFRINCCAWIRNNVKISIFHCQHHFILILIAGREERAEHVRNGPSKTGRGNNSPWRNEIFGEGGINLRNGS
jgi:hypothetical protein